MRGTLGPVLASPSLRRLQLGWLIGVVAARAYFVAILVTAYEIGGVLAVGTFTLLASLPAGLFGPILSTVADGFAPPRVLVGLHLARALIVGVAAVAVASGLGLGLVLACVVLEGIVNRQHTATTRSLLPALARTPDELVAGNGVTSLGEAVGALVGPALAGVLLVLGGPVLPLAAAAAGYVVAMGLAAGIEVVSPAPRDAAPARSRGPWGDVVGGIRALGAHRSAGLLVWLYIAQSLIRSLLTVLLVSAAIDLIGIGEAGVGYLNAAIGAGGLIGAGLGMTMLIGRGLSNGFTLSLILVGLPITVMGAIPNPGIAFVMATIIGAAKASIDVTGYTLLARCVPNEVRGRVFGLLQSLVGIGAALGALAAPVLVGILGLQAALVVAGLVLPALALATYGAVRRAEAAVVLPERELIAMRGVPMFAPLPLTSLEHLARSLVPVRFGSREQIITQGEPGDCYYLIESGTVDIVHDGHLETTLGHGDGFGEIALLDDRPRTATVVAAEPVSGFRLPRAAFLEAVAASPHAVRAADALVSQRLDELARH